MVEGMISSHIFNVLLIVGGLLIVGHLCSETASNCYNAYFVGQSHDREASVWQFIGMVARVLAVIYLCISLVLSSSNDFRFTVRNNSMPRTESLNDRIYDKFSDSMDMLTGRILGSADDFDLSDGNGLSY